MTDSELEVKEMTLSDVRNSLLTCPPSMIPDNLEDYMTDEAWDLWSRCMYEYGDRITPKSVLDAYVDDIEAESDGYY